MLPDPQACPRVAGIVSDAPQCVHARRRSRASASASDLERSEIGAKLVGQIWPRQREFHGGLQESELVAGVIALALELHRVHRALTAERAQRIGELDLSAAVGRRAREQ